MKIERAVLSVTEKKGIVDFARRLAEWGVELLSTGGTARLLREAGLAVRDISDYTEFPEMLDGRVKTLHPKVHGGILYLRDHPGHQRTAEEYGIRPIDLVCVNLYRFEDTVARQDVTLNEAVENIDIGGPAMLRSAAKNYRFVTVVCDPADYDLVIACMKEHEGETTLELRQKLAQKAFATTAVYDAVIARYLAQTIQRDTTPPFVVSYLNGRKLRYGENPHQDAWFYREPAPREATVAHAEVLHGKEMSYNNYLDADAALEAAKEMTGQPAAVVVKHTNPCGYATGDSLAEALEAAWAGDPVSAFGSVIAVTCTVDLTAAQVLKGRFVEALIAPEFTEDALSFLKAKSKDIRLLRLRAPIAPPQKGLALRQISGGLLVQERDAEAEEQWVVPTEQIFPEEKRALAEFGIKVCKHVKSNAIVIVREYKSGRFALLGMGAGQPNRVDALSKLAVARARENIRLITEHATQYGQHPKDIEAEIMGNSVLVSDAFFPFPDNIEAAAQAGIRYIVHPGGSRKDEEVIAACDRYGIAMVMTGVRHFKH